MAYIGVIEGFYGQAYSYENRYDLLNFLKEQAYNFYIYAPKQDKSLRSKDFVFEADKQQELIRLSRAYQEQGLDFGIAISPLELSIDFANKKEQFLRFVQDYVAAVKPSIFCLLFDDMPKTSDDLGKVQADIANCVYAAIKDKVKRFIFCPSYYTFDPLLDKLFGQRPEHYFSDLGANLDSNIEIFWTGNKVIPETICKHDIEEINAILKRKIFIWDNYPVNDGRKSSSFLNLNPFMDRRDLAEVTTGHAINPMKQYHLSKIPLMSLPLIYAGKDPTVIFPKWHRVLLRSLPKIKDTAQFIELVQHKGLDNLTKPERNFLFDISKDKASVYERELDAFLHHMYDFDEECLTD